MLVSPAPKAVAVVVATALAYFLCAKLGLAFAISPGFASAIWPAAGVAIAFVLTYGNPAIAGIFLGSFAANLSVEAQPLWQLAPHQLLLPAGIALGSCLQAKVAQCLTRSIIAKDPYLHSIHHILRFVFVAGPLSCLVAATIGAGLLALLKDLTPGDTGFVFLVWWIGDSLGVTMFAPALLLLFAATNPHHSARRTWQVAVPSLIVFSLISGFFVLTRDQHRQSTEHRFAEDAAQLIRAFEHFRDRTYHSLHSLSALYRSSVFVSREEFGLFSQHLLLANRAIDTLAWIPRIHENQTDIFEKNAHNEGLVRFQIKNLTEGADKQATPQGPRFPIYYAEPTAKRLSLLGLDLGSDADLRLRLLQSARSGASISIPWAGWLEQSSGQQQGFATVSPVYQSGVGERSALEAREREARLEGFLLITGTLSSSFDRLLLQPGLQHLGLKILTQTHEQPRVLYQSPDWQAGNAKLQQHFEVFGSQWTLLIRPLDSFYQAHKDWGSWLVMIAGALLGTLSQIFLLTLTGFNQRLGQEIERKTGQLQQALDEAAYASRLKSQFLANMSHEIRTPLNAIVGFTELGLKKCQEALSRDYFQRVQTASRVLLDIVNDILDISRIEAGKLSIQATPFTLSSLLDEVNVIFSHMAQAKDIDFQIECVPGTPNQWIGDPVRIKQVLLNLCGNGVKFTDRGKVRVLIKGWQEAAAPKGLEICVMDTGVGIGSEQAGRLFQPFVQADNSSTRRFGGAGLGLSIVKNLCQLMGGDVRVESMLGHGSRFTATVACSPVAEPSAPAAAPARSHPSPAPELAGHRVLVAEDVKINQSLVEALLADMKITCVLVDDGAAVLERLATDPDIDLVLMDIQMPVMNGYDAAKMIRHTYGNKLPVIALSANVTHEDRHQALNAGMNDILAKPLDPEALQQMLCKYLAPGTLS